MTALAAISFAIWLYLLLGRGMFWLMRARDDTDEPRQSPEGWPSVAAIVPARDEVDVIARTLSSLVSQDYPGPFRVFLVDDGSSDGTAEKAREAVIAMGAAGIVELLHGEERPRAWTGKLWAMQQGVARATELHKPEYLLFTDADIAHTPENLRQLVVRAKARNLVLISLMAKLHCESVAEKLFIPAFVFFFAMLYPFAWANDSRRKIAAAAGGCMLVRRAALEAAGGLRAIAGAIIDDCALARVLKPQGPIWLGLTRRAASIRPYGGIAEIGHMIARSAYAQLRYSPLLLIGTVLGMIVVYAAPPVFAIFGAGSARILGFVTWLTMAIAYGPILRFYRLSPLWEAALPAIGAVYTGFTINSAVQHWRGLGGMWKGRAQAMA